MSPETENSFQIEEYGQSPITIVPGELPVIIEGQVQKPTALSGNVEKATQAAEKARQSAKNAREMTVNILWGKTKAIEELQKYAVDATESSLALAKAQEKSFEFQTQLAEVTKYLFMLGAGNLALNRLIVRELKARLEGASHTELSELAKSELNNVIKQLKAQGDILSRQDDLGMKVKSHNESLLALTNDSQEHSKSLDGLTAALGELSQQVIAQNEIIEDIVTGLGINSKRITDNYQNLLDMQVELDKQKDQDQQLAASIQDNLKTQIIINNDLLSKLKLFEEMTVRHEQLLPQMQRGGRLQFVVACSIGAIGVLLGTISLFMLFTMR